MGAGPDQTGDRIRWAADGEEEGCVNPEGKYIQGLGQDGTLTLDHIWLFAFGGDKLEVQRFPARPRRRDFAEDEGAILVGPRDADDAGGGHHNVWTGCLGDHLGNRNQHVFC